MLWQFCVTLWIFDFEATCAVAKLWKDTPPHTHTQPLRYMFGNTYISIYLWVCVCICVNPLLFVLLCYLSPGWTCEDMCESVMEIWRDILKEIFHSCCLKCTHVCWWVCMQKEHVGVWVDNTETLNITCILRLMLDRQVQVYFISKAQKFQ